MALTGGYLSMQIWIMIWLRAAWAAWAKREENLLTGLGMAVIFSLGNNAMRQPMLLIFLLSIIFLHYYSQPQDNEKTEL